MTLPVPRRPSRAQALVAVIALVTAFLTVVQLRTERQMRRLLGFPSPQLAELAYRMQREEQRRAGLEAEMAKLREGLAAVIEAAGEGQRGLRSVSEEVRAYRLLAGFAPVEGPGVVVELADNPRPLRPGENPNEVLLHYTDLVRVVSALWAAGAEAVAINGERLVATSGIECVGTTILVNRRRLAPPFRIVAIGDPERLLGDVGRPGGGLDLLKSFGFPVRVARAPKVELPPYRGIIASVRGR